MVIKLRGRMGCISLSFGQIRRLHCKIGKLPFIYLGLPIGAKARSKAVWDPIMENFERKLSMWKRNYLSLGERITLIKASLSNLPVYYTSQLSMPMTVRERLGCIRNDFLWAGQDKKKIHLLKLSSVILPKAMGGLEIKN